MRKTLVACCLIFGVLALAVAVAAPGGGGTGGARITVVPADDLPEVATVDVSGTGFGSGADVGIWMCSDVMVPHPMGGIHGKTCRGLAATTAEQDGSFGPVSVLITQTFEGEDGFGRPRTDTCRPTNDCTVWAGSGDPPAGLGPPKLAWRQLTFAG